MTELYWCTICERNHKVDSKIGKEHILYMKSEESTLEPGPEVAIAPASDGRPGDREGEPAARPDVALEPELGEGVSPQDADPPAPEMTEEEQIIAAIMDHPLLAPMFLTIRELHVDLGNAKADLKAFKGDIVKIIEDILASIEYLKQVPTGEPDLMEGFDRFIEKYGLEDSIKKTIDRIPAILERAVGGDPATTELGPEFLERVKVAYVKEQDLKNLALEKLTGALSRGEEVYLLSPEDAERARKEGFIKDEEEQDDAK